jgi:gamma-glutamyl-gamma-aminobutyrate hydrolase PuuD
MTTMTVRDRVYDVLFTIALVLMLPVLCICAGFAFIVDAARGDK